MKLLNRGLLFFTGVVSIFFLTACGGGNGGPGGAIGGGAGATGSGGVTGNAPGAGGGLGGLTLNTRGGVNVSADLLRAQGINLSLLNRQELARLQLTGIVPLDARVLRRNGTIIGVQLPNGSAFSLPGARPTTLPGIGTLPTLPSGGVVGRGLGGTLNNLVGGLRR